MKGFLAAVAEGYASNFKSDLSRVTFVMPNKRSGSFLLRELSTYCGRPTLAPRIVTISDFVADVADLVPDHRLSSLFLLFDCYRKISSVGDMDFDRFSSWGETVLNDFNEIDMAMVDPDEIFKNVSDLNSIRTDFLTDEQKRVIEKYFGYTYRELEEGEKKFWETFENMDDVADESNVKKRYYNLWQILRPLYYMFKERLRSEGLTTAGGAFRSSVEKVEDGFEPYPGEKLVMVGFNALTEAERRIFKALKKLDVNIGGSLMPKTDFIWDPVSEYLAGSDDPAVRFVNYNMDAECFPSPRWMDQFLEKSRPDKAPEIEVVAVPSNVMQAKLICTKLENLFEEISGNVDDARVAVVLPDENLLLPLLYSLPEKYSSPNLTMGYPLKHTPVVSFAALLRRLQTRVRLVKGRQEFYFEDVKDLLGHPYSQLLFGRDSISDYIKQMRREKRITVGYDTMSRLGSNASVVFQCVTEEQPDKVLLYVSEILNLVRTKLTEDGSTYLRTSIETSFIDTFQRALVLIGGCIGRYETQMSALGVMRLVERQTASEKVPFEGEPLKKGLQVMGLLETRALDFNYVFMPSMNDKVMPRRGRNSTFIPNALRMAYGMPPASYQEELFAYYFYRLAGRCSRLTLTYDARSGNNKSGGVSRFVLQLLYLTDREKVRIKKAQAHFGNLSEKNCTRTVAKSDDIMQRMRLYYTDAKPGEGEKLKKISASALSYYGQCPLKFLYAYVDGIRIEPEPMETIDAIDLGSIVHEVMERLYTLRFGGSHVLFQQPVEITSDFLSGLLRLQTASGEGLIEAETKRAINRYHFHLEEKYWESKELRGTAIVVFEYIVEMVKSIIRFDMRKTPFLLHGCEITENYAYRLPDGRCINFTMVIDRLDEVDGKLRIVDYKTGKVHLEARKLCDIFDGTQGAKNILQLVVYAMILDRMVKEGKLAVKGWNPENLSENISMVIYSIPGIRKADMEGKPSNGNPPEVLPKMENVEIGNLADFLDLTDENGANFKDYLDRQLEEILDRDIPFTAEPSDDRCRYCDYKIYCENQRCSVSAEESTPEDGK